MVAHEVTHRARRLPLGDALAAGVVVRCDDAGGRILLVIVADVDRGLAALCLLHPLAVAVVGIGRGLTVNCYGLEPILFIPSLRVGHTVLGASQHVAVGVVAVGVGASRGGGVRPDAAAPRRRVGAAPHIALVGQVADRGVLVRLVVALRAAVRRGGRQPVQRIVAEVQPFQVLACNAVIRSTG